MQKRVPVQQEQREPPGQREVASAWEREQLELREAMHIQLLREASAPAHSSGCGCNEGPCTSVLRTLSTRD